MRAFLLLLLTAAACATRGPPAAPSPGARDEVRALEDEYLREHFRRVPEEATRSGWPDADHAGVTDIGPEAIARWQRFEDGLLARARAIDRKALAGTPESVTLGILVDALEGSVATRPCRSELWSVSSIGGWPGRYASLAEVQPVGTPTLKEAAKERLRRVAGRIDQEVVNLREGVSLGYVATRENVQRVLGEVDRLLATPPGAWPYTRPAARADDPALKGELTAIVERDVLPAAQRYRTYLANEYLERARAKPSLLALPDGERCYRASVRRRVTIEVEPQAIHQTGLARMEAIHAEMRKIAERTFGTSDVTALLRRLREDPAFRFHDKGEILAVTDAAVHRAEAAMPRWFGRVPEAKVSVREYPEFRRASNPAESYTEDFSTGRLAGIYFINAFDPEHKPRADVESTAFHEAIPGHHLQIALAHERGGGPRISKYVMNSGFTEGWALYAERLAGEMGLFSADVYRLGGLASEAFRAARLVVDSGLNVFGWSRQQAIDYMVANAGIDPDFAASEVDRYVAWPGQATAYMLGALEILRLRGDAEQALGARFDVRAFHDAVLEDGSVTLAMLRERIARFVDERKGSGVRAAAR
ncbi:MAG TPA: DUF885 domain-containing protein [Anaeromyxobacter sp.]|nr:DUF885 domain-containing protein [Anaeromyxobacter sp.]